MPASGGGAGSGGGSTAVSGSSSMKVEPREGRLSTSMRPPSSVASSRLIASPRPVPPKRRVVDMSPWLKAWNSVARWSSAMPMPVSRTAMRTQGWPSRPGLGRGEHAHLAGGGELDGVADQVVQDLAQPRPGRRPPAAAGRRRSATAARRPWPAACGANSLGSVVDRVVQVERRRVPVRMLAGLELGQVEHVVDERRAAPPSCA